MVGFRAYFFLGASSLFAFTSLDLRPRLKFCWDVPLLYMEW